MGTNGGAIAQRGFNYQTIVAMIECFDRHDWDEIKIEPETDNDKVDIMLYRGESIISAIQVKTSKNRFKKKNVLEWLKQLKDDAGKSETVLLYLVGDYFQDSCKTFLENNDEIRTLPFNNIEDICKGKLVDYLNKKGLGKGVYIGDLDKINDIIFAKLQKNSMNKDTFSRTALEDAFQDYIQSLAHIESRSFIQIDSDYIKKCKVDESKYERYRFDYYYASKSFESVFRAVVNNLIATTPEYEDILNKIYETINNNPILMLMAEGGTGKSTLVAKLGVRLAGEGNLVFYSDSVNPESTDLDNMIDRIKDDPEQNIYILIDNAAKNHYAISKLCSITEQNIHVLICDRIYKINSLINNENQYINDWNLEGKGIILKNNKSSCTVLLKPRNTIEYELSEETRRILSKEAIDTIIRFYEDELDKSVCKQVIEGISYENHSITDIILEFCITYNSIAKKQIYKPKFIRFDWDEWDDIHELKGKFRYLAALNLYGINVTIHQMEKIIDNNIEESLFDRKLQVVRLDRDVIRLRHDTVADNYFKAKHIEPYKVIEELLEDNLLVNRTKIMFAKEVFSLANIYSKSSEVKSLCIPQLVQQFNRNQDYRKLLEDNQRIHSLEFALIAIKAENKKEKEKTYRLEIGESFNRVRGYYPNIESLWMKYFFFSVYHGDGISEVLLQPLNSEGLYKKVTRNINGYIRKNYRNLEHNEREKWIKSLEQLFTWIIFNIDNNDIPSRILLLWVYRHSNRIKEAKQILFEMYALSERMNNQAGLDISFLELLAKEVRQFLKKDRSDPRIRGMNKFIRQNYEYLIEDTIKATDDYVSIVRSYMRFQKDTGHFDEAYEIGIKTLKELGVSQIELTKIYIELGMLCQFRRGRNKFYNLNESIVWFKKAIDSIASSKREKLYALKPLCKSYLFNGNYLDCLNICRQIEIIDPRDKEVLTYQCEAVRLQRIKEYKLPVENKDVLSENYEEERDRRPFKQLVGEMTSEQRTFLDLYQLPNINQTYYAYRAVVRIKNNKFIPHAILSKIEISDTKTLHKLINETISREDNS